MAENTVERFTSRIIIVPKVGYTNKLSDETSGTYTTNFP